MIVASSSSTVLYSTVHSDNDDDINQIELNYAKMEIPYQYITPRPAPVL